MEKTPQGENISSPTHKKCQNCSEFFYISINERLPIVIRCGHSICKKCFDSCSEFLGDVICKICRMDYQEGDKAVVPVNISFLNLLAEVECLDTQIDKFRKDFRGRLIEKCCYLRNCLPMWTDQYFDGVALYMTLKFWQDEAYTLQKNVDIASARPACTEFIGQAFQDASRLLPKLETVSEFCKQTWDELLKEHRTKIINPRNSLSVSRVSILRALKNVDEDFYMSRFCTYEKFFCKLTAGETFIHVHSGFLDNEDNQDYYSKLKVLETSWKPTYATHAFLDLSFKQDDGKEIQHRVYIRLEEYKNCFQCEIIQLFLGESGNTFKGIRILNDKSVLTLEEPDYETLIFDKPLSLALEGDQKRVQRNESGLVLGTKGNFNVKLNIFVNEPPSDLEYYYFGKIESGIDFLRTKSTLEGQVIDCGVVAKDLDF